MSEKMYAWLLKLYPVRFRGEYAASALQLFRDRMRAERGLFRRLRFWLDMIADLAVSLPHEHLRREAVGPEADGAFSISEGAVTALVIRGFVSALCVIIFVGIGLSAGWLGNANHILLLMAYLPLLIVSLWKLIAVRRAEENWLSYRLVMGSDCLRLKQSGKEITIARSGIIKINEDEYGLRVFGLRGMSPAVPEGPIDHRRMRDLASSIWIPEGLTGYEQVKEQMFRWTHRTAGVRSQWVRDLKSEFLCAASLLPAMLLVHSAAWFLAIAGVYYGVVVLALGTDILHPPLKSWKRLRRRFARIFRKPPFLILLILPIVRLVFPL